MLDLHLDLDRAAGRLGVQLAVRLREAIRAGRLPESARLPSTRALAQDLGVSRGVVVTAYEQLAAEGFLVSRPGDGTRVARLPAVPTPRDLPAAGADPGGEYDLRPGTPDLTSFPRAKWTAALKLALEEMAHTDFAYPHPAGAPVLRRELAGYLGRVRAAVAAPEQVVVTAGVAHGLSAVVRLAGVPLAIEDPLSDRQLPLLRATGAPLIRVPVDEEGMDVEALARSGAGAVLLTPAHQFPTGVVLSSRRRAALVEWAEAAGALILEDDYDAEFRYDRDPVGCVQGLAPERTVLFGSVSKTLAPGLRLGWLVAPAGLAARVADHRMDTDLGSPVIEQHALAGFLASGAYDRHLRQMRRIYRSRRDALVGALAARLPEAGIDGISAGLHLFLRLPYPVPDLAEAAAARGVLVQTCGPSALIVGYSALTEARLAEAVARLAEAVRRGRPRS
ncbi:PLP-dependent aminotransferase family protein [Actinocorallia sp. B10E7]|uniref:MocR-like pyridoxine biosynthesis transcription factor PdxR n=1 Tax=Actinocorallia sp. B10E7 TaxID=3153558 RepID=UPI00325EADBE